MQQSLVPPTISELDTREFVAFLREAHVQGWPEGIAPVSMAGLHGFYEFRHQNGSWEYLDLFGGDVTDVGFEVVFHEGGAVWGTSYRGGVIAPEVPPADVFEFLVESIAAAESESETFSLRGPDRYDSTDGRWNYRYAMNGNLASYVAFERIWFEGNLVYERVLTGGQFGGRLYGSSIPLCDSVLAL